MTSIADDWLKSSSVDNSRDFDVVHVSEARHWTQSDAYTIGSILAENTINPDMLKDAARHLGWSRDETYEKLFAESQPNAEAVKKGKFGEILHAEVLSKLSSLSVPVKRYTCMPNPNVSPPGIDLIAFEITGDKISVAHYAETKLLTLRNYAMIIRAYEQLRKVMGMQVTVRLRHALGILYMEDRRMYSRILDYMTRPHIRRSSA